MTPPSFDPLTHPGIVEDVLNRISHGLGLEDLGFTPQASEDLSQAMRDGLLESEQVDLNERYGLSFNFLQKLVQKDPTPPRKFDIYGNPLLTVSEEEAAIPFQTNAASQPRDTWVYLKQPIFCRDELMARGLKIVVTNLDILDICLANLDL